MSRPASGSSSRPIDPKPIGEKNAAAFLAALAEQVVQPDDAGEAAKHLALAAFAGLAVSALDRRFAHIGHGDAALVADCVLGAELIDKGGQEDDAGQGEDF